ncbi:polysaccharide deacetylase family protein [Amorphus sp. 3PC139-8]|uniref:polysaccharide deacetylase family protein n=1 Tax=Amorphus sp. 3PC139-8 TaxID=2735676 RepID=UPI00345DAAEA
MTGSAPDFADRLSARLDAAASAGKRIAFWWRDDDAVAPSDALDRLLALAHTHDVPLALAVIPAEATRALADRLTDDGRTSVLQHGWAHANHAGADAKSAELGSDRPIDTVLDELSRGHQRLGRLFGERFLPVLVPPWNRIAPEVAARRAEAGLAGLSCFKSLSTEEHRLDAHLDPIAWRGGRGFVGWQEMAAALDAEIDRRDGQEMPIGLLTHHLVHDGETWAFLEAFLAVAANHPGANWPPIPEAFGLD